MHLKVLEKQEQFNPRISARKKITKIRTETNERETIKTIQIIELKIWFFKRINKLDKPLAKLTLKRKEKIQINAIRNKNVEINADTVEIPENS